MKRRKSLIAAFLCLLIASCAAPIARSYPDPVLPRSSVAYLIVDVYQNYVESIDGIDLAALRMRNGVDHFGILEIPASRHEIRASYWKMEKGIGGRSTTTTAGGKNGLPLTFVAEPRHIYRVDNSPSCASGNWCPYIKDITSKVDVPSNYEHVYQKARE